MGWIGERAAADASIGHALSEGFRMALGKHVVKTCAWNEICHTFGESKISALARAFRLLAQYLVNGIERRPGGNGLVILFLIGDMGVADLGGCGFDFHPHQSG